MVTKSFARFSQEFHGPYLTVYWDFVGPGGQLSGQKTVDWKATLKAIFQRLKPYMIKVMKKFITIYIGKNGVPKDEESAGGFWSRLKKFGKKLWKGIKKIANNKFVQAIGKAVWSVAKTVASAYNPAIGTAMGAVEKVWSAVKKARSGNPQAITTIGNVIRQADSGNRVAQQATALIASTNQYYSTLRAASSLPAGIW